MNRKKYCWLCLGAAAGYLAVLGLLTLAERSDPNSSIQTVADAFWYSLVTMSTVGYGDLYPVTTVGRILGAVFILLSLGALAFLLGLLIRIITGRMLPAFQLWMARHNTWYIFSCHNSAAYALAKDLRQRDPECTLLFPPCADTAPPEQLRYLIYHDAPETLAARKKDRCSICFMDEADPYAQAVAALRAGHPVYCRTAFAPDANPENLTLFNPYDCYSQRYWQDHGLKPEEKTVLLIGDGKYAQALLDHGLLLNVFGPDRRIAYHVFGDWENYRRNHHCLGASLCLDGSDAEMDQLHFHAEFWNEDPALLASGARIILCRDTREENIELLSQLRRYFPVTGRIHLFSHDLLPGETVFGTEESIYTAPLVLQAQLSQAARTMHRIYRDRAGGNAPAWEQLSEFLRQSNMAAAAHLLTKVRILLENDSICALTPENCAAAYARYRDLGPEQKEICRQIEHQRWMRFHSMYNWKYAPVRNNPAREHPLMVPYEKLAASQQKKDDFAWELLEELAAK